MSWTEERVEALKQMWKEGLTTSEIARRLDVSKNSIVGKVHRLGLSGRPSPIKRKPEENNKKTEIKLEKKAETKTKSKVEKKAEKNIIDEDNCSTIVETKAKANKRTTANKKQNDGVVRLVDLDGHTCRWPIGDPKDEKFHFCGKKIKVGNTYCDEHAELAFVKQIRK